MTAASETSAAATPRLKRPARVVLASINREHGDTGVHTHGRMLAAGLRDAGVNCDVVSSFSGSKKWLPIFAVRPLLLHRINKTCSTLWHRRWHRAALHENLKTRLSRGGVDAIVAQCPVSAAAAMDVRRELGLNVPVAMVCHFNHSEAKEYRDKGELAGIARYEQMLAFENGVLESVDRVIYVSNWARENVENDRKVNTRSSAVIWNGVSAKTQTTPLSRAELELDEDDVVLINVGSIEPRKNQVGLVDLFASIHESFPATRLVLVGDGPQRSAVEEKVKAHRLGDSVKLLGHRRDVPAILPCADLYLHYASLENCPLVLIEAARASLPFAAVATGGVPELQDALDCKFDIDATDIRATTDRLRLLLANPQSRREQGQRAKQAFERTFTLEAMTQAYINALSFASQTAPE